jgi:hypothetical protein
VWNRRAQSQVYGKAGNIISDGGGTDCSWREGEGRFCETLQVERLTGERDADAPAVIAVPLQRGMIRVRR